MLYSVYLKRKNVLASLFSPGSNIYTIYVWTHAVYRCNYLIKLAYLTTSFI